MTKEQIKLLRVENTLHTRLKRLAAFEELTITEVLAQMILFSLGKIDNGSFKLSPKPHSQEKDKEAELSEVMNTLKTTIKRN